MKRYQLPDIQKETEGRLVRRINEIMRDSADYESMRGDHTASVGDLLKLPEHRKQTYPRTWIRDCWAEEFGPTPPHPYRDLWPFVQDLSNLCNFLDISPVKVVRLCNPDKVKNMKSYINGLKTKLHRENEDESYQQWLRRISL